MPNILNISAYRFATLDDPAALAQRIEKRATTDGLKGTVLLAGEGINLFLAGPAETVRGFVSWLRKVPALAGLETKESWSDTPPFGKLRVKVTVRRRRTEVIEYGLWQSERIGMPAGPPTRG